MRLNDYVAFQREEIQKAIKKVDSELIPVVTLKGDIFELLFDFDHNDKEIEFILNVKVRIVEEKLREVIEAAIDIKSEILKGNYDCKEIIRNEHVISVNSYMKDIKLMEVSLDADVVYEYKEPNMIYIDDEMLEKPLYQVLTFKEASALWGIDDSTLRRRTLPENRINNDLQYDIDYRKSGSTWLITKEAMERVYGKLNE